MPFENNGTLQKWLITNTPPDIDKYSIHKKWSLTLQKTFCEVVFFIIGVPFLKKCVSMGAANIRRLYC